MCQHLLPNTKWGYFDKLEAEEALLSIWKTSCKQCQWKMSSSRYLRSVTTTLIGSHSMIWYQLYGSPKYLQEFLVALFPLAGGAARLDTESIRRSVFPKLLKRLSC